MRINQDKIPGLNYNKFRWKKMVVEVHVYHSLVNVKPVAMDIVILVLVLLFAMWRKLRRILLEQSNY